MLPLVKLFLCICSIVVELLADFELFAVHLLFLADRTIGRAYGTVCLCLSVVRL